MFPIKLVKLATRKITVTTTEGTPGFCCVITTINLANPGVVENLIPRLVR